MCVKDQIETDTFKPMVLDDICFNKTMEINNYYNLYKSLKIDVYKDIPDEEIDNFDTAGDV